MVFSFLTRVGLRPSLPTTAPSAIAHTMTRSCMTRSIKNKSAMKKLEGTQSITPLFILSTIFSAMFVSSAKPLGLPQTTPVPRLERRSEFAEADHGLWHSVFNWTFLMLIITPRPDVRRMNKHRQQSCATNTNTGLLHHLSRLFSIVHEIFSTAVKGVFATLRSSFASKSKPQPPILPLHVSHVTRVDTPLEQPTAAPSTIPKVSRASENTIQTPARAMSPTSRIPKPDPATPPKTSPTTARLLSTLADLEAQMKNHQFYDLESELEHMDNQMSEMFDLAWMPRKITSPTPTLAPSSPQSPIAMILPQAPPPTRRDRKTIQILPMICEVSENSADLSRTPPYDPRRWSIATFQPLWGPRAHVGTVY